MRFGSDEHLVCLQHVDAPGPNGASVCLGYKYTDHWFGLPAYVSDDGYVLRFEGTDRYIPLDAARIHDAQQEHLLPDPLPSYSLGAGTYLWGFALWPALIVGALLSWRLARRKARKLAVRLAADAEQPIARGGPELDTDGDRYIQEQLAARLHDGERIKHQAYGTTRMVSGSALGVFVSAARQKGVLAALTNERLFLIETRVGARKPLLENRGVEVIERAQIAGVDRADRALTVRLDDGMTRTTRTIIVDPRARYFSNQDAFLRDLPRVIAPAPAAPPKAS